MASQLNGLEFEQAPGDGEGQGSLACCITWGCKDSDTTGEVNNKIRMWETPSLAPKSMTVFGNMISKE